MGERCTRCGKPITGAKEQTTRIWDGTGDAHFFCYYPDGIIPPQPTSRWFFGELQRNAPDRLIYFTLAETPIEKE